MEADIHPDDGSLANAISSNLEGEAAEWLVPLYDEAAPMHLLYASELHITCVRTVSLQNMNCDRYGLRQVTINVKRAR